MNSNLSILGAWFIVAALLAVIVLPQTVRILREYERGVIFRWGKVRDSRGPGLIFLIPFVDRMVRMDLRVVTIDVPRQEIMTRDNVPASVDAVVFCATRAVPHPHPAIQACHRRDHRRRLPTSG